MKIFLQIFVTENSITQLLDKRMDNFYGFILYLDHDEIERLLPTMLSRAEVMKIQECSVFIYSSHGTVSLLIQDPASGERGPGSPASVPPGTT